MRVLQSVPDDQLTAALTEGIDVRVCAAVQTVQWSYVIEVVFGELKVVKGVI